MDFNALDVADREVPGGVAEDHAFTLQRTEETAHSRGQPAAGVAGHPIHGVLHLVLGDLPQRGHADGRGPGGEGGLEVAEVAADAVVPARLALTRALLAQDLHPGAHFARDRPRQRGQGRLDPHLIRVPVQGGILHQHAASAQGPGLGIAVRDDPAHAPGGRQPESARLQSRLRVGRHLVEEH